MNPRNRARTRKGRGTKPSSQSKTKTVQPANGHLAAAAGDSSVRRSDIYLAACIAAQKKLPEQSRLLLEAFDALIAEWRASEFSPQILSAMVPVARAIRIDPLASIALDLRQKSNSERVLERRAINPPESNMPAVKGGER